MSVVTNILQFIVVLGLLLFFHEFGHLIVSLLFKIDVEEFGFGLPPRIVRLFRFKNIDFTLNWIPFGAFVRPKGENDPAIPDGLAAANPWIRLAVFLGGPFMNLLVGVIVLVVLYSSLGVPNPSVVLIAQISPGSPAEISGLKPGDIILQVNQDKIDSMEKMQMAIKASLGQPVQVLVRRGPQTLTILPTPRTNPPEGQGYLGVLLENAFQPLPVYRAIPAAGQSFYQQVEQFVTLPVQLIRGTIAPSLARVVGIKGIYDIYNQASQMDAQAAANPIQTPPIFRLSFIATISIALGLTNLLPIPALDGGRILFVLPEIITRRRIPAQYENLVHAIGLIAMLLLMVYITIQDFVNPVLLPR
jgi:regulator of sigma E protease